MLMVLIQSQSKPAALNMNAATTAGDKWHASHTPAVLVAIVPSLQSIIISTMPTAGGWMYRSPICCRAPATTVYSAPVTCNLAAVECLVTCWQTELKLTTSLVGCPVCKAEGFLGTRTSDVTTTCRS